MLRENSGGEYYLVKTDSEQFAVINQKPIKLYRTNAGLLLPPDFYTKEPDPIEFEEGAIFSGPFVPPKPFYSPPLTTKQLASYLKNSKTVYRGNTDYMNGKIIVTKEFIKLLP